MTVYDLIVKVDAIKPNVFTNDQKLDWINELFYKLEKELYETHRREETKHPRPLYHKYTLDDNKDKPIGIMDEIDIPDAFLDAVEYWVMAKIDLFNTDLDRYTNSMILFNNAYSDYKKWYHRTHMPKGERRIK